MAVQDPALLKASLVTDVLFSMLTTLGVMSARSLFRSSYGRH